MYDLLLRNGRIYDGSGMPSFVADLAIRDGRIAAIGRINEAATQVLDADGLAVAPGHHRFSHPLRRPDLVGPAGLLVERAWCYHRCLRQLRPDFDAVQAGESRCADRHLRAG